MTKVTDKIRDLIDPRHEGFRHTMLFKVLIGLALLILLGVIYSVFISPDERQTMTDDESESEAARQAALDTLDVVGDYLWPGAKTDNADDGKKKDEEEAKPIEHAQAAPQAEAATDEDIEAATGQLPENNEEKTSEQQKEKKEEVPKMEVMSKPTVQEIE